MNRSKNGMLTDGTKMYKKFANFLSAGSWITDGMMFVLSRLSVLLICDSNLSMVIVTIGKQSLGESLDGGN